VDRGQGGEMAQTMYTHMNNEKKIKNKKYLLLLEKKKKEARQVVWGLTLEEINVPE
jgi:hypothetical protein